MSKSNHNEENQISGGSTPARDDKKQYCAPMPSPIVALCEQDGRVKDLVKAALPFALGHAIYAGPGRSRLRRLRYGLRLANGTAYWKGLVMKEIFQSTHPRFSTVPGLLLPYYALLRPLFWVGRKFKNKLR